MNFKNTSLFLLALGLSLMACKKTKTCSCYDPNGKQVYHDVVKTRSKLELKHFEDDCTNKKNTYYYIGTGTTVPTQTQIPCVIE